MNEESKFQQADNTCQILKLLKEQREISDEMNAILIKPKGLNDTSTRICKNLVAAVACAQSPGFFQYYEPSPEVKEIYDTNQCAALVKKITKTQTELNSLSKKEEKIQQPSDLTRNISSLDHWFASYGRPTGPIPPGLGTTFTNKNSRIYGATTHHRAFRSQAIVMKRGKI